MTWYRFFYPIDVTNAIVFVFASQIVMRLGKKKEKEKESESKSQVVEGINRLVCQAKTHHSLLKGKLIDRLELVLIN